MMYVFSTLVWYTTRLNKLLLCMVSEFGSMDGVSRPWNGFWRTKLSMWYLQFHVTYSIKLTNFDVEKALKLVKNVDVRRRFDIKTSTFLLGVVKTKCRKSIGKPNVPGNKSHGQVSHLTSDGNQHVQSIYG